MSGLKTTDDFWGAFIISGRLVTDCEGCGTTYFADDGDYEEGEKDELIQNSINHPDKYVHWPYSNVDVLHFGGKDIVDGCPKCDERISRYEDFVWEHRDGIRKYLTKRCRKEAEEANRQVELNEKMNAEATTQ